MIKYLILMVFGELVASSSQILLKKSAGKHYSSFIREYLNVLVITGYAMLAFSMLISIICYGGLGYMRVVVMEPIGYIIVMFLSRIFFQERITVRKISGMILLLTGILVFYLA